MGAKREEKIESTPGPGEYTAKSDFGYESKMKYVEYEVVEDESLMEESYKQSELLKMKRDM